MTTNQKLAWATGLTLGGIALGLILRATSKPTQEVATSGTTTEGEDTFTPEEDSMATALSTTKADFPTQPEQMIDPQTPKKGTTEKALKAFDTLDDQFPLQLGSKGPKVERLKVWLMRNYGADGIVTDLFDQRTQERVQKFLKVNEVSKKIYNRFRMGKHVQQQTIMQ